MYIYIERERYIDQTRPDQTRPDQTRPDQTRPDQTGTDRTGPDRTRPDRTGQDQTRVLAWPSWKVLARSPNGSALRNRRQRWLELRCCPRGASSETCGAERRKLAIYCMYTCLHLEWMFNPNVMLYQVCVSFKQEETKRNQYCLF